MGQNGAAVNIMIVVIWMCIIIISPMTGLTLYYIERTNCSNIDVYYNRAFYDFSTSSPVYYSRPVCRSMLLHPTVGIIIIRYNN